MAPAEASQAKFTAEPLKIGVAVVTRKLAGVSGGGGVTVSVKAVVLFKGEPVTVTAMPLSLVGVWALVEIVKVDVQVFSVGTGEQDAGEKEAEDWLGKPLAERETLSAVPALLVTVTVLVTEEPWVTLIVPLLERE